MGLLSQPCPAVADRLTPARCTARASKTVTPAARSSPARRRRPLPHVSSVNCALALLFLCESQLHFNKRRKQDGDQQFIQTTGEYAAMRQHQGDDLGE